jgi:hypothetical protein
MGRLFGTDGIRGVANVDLTPTLAYDLGRAVGHLLEAFGRRVVIGQDTRRSGDRLVAAVSAGLVSVGADAIQLGVVTTPCLAHAAANGDFAAGIMVSASHNPADDNGLKVLDGQGLKLDDAVEDELEQLIWREGELSGVGKQHPLSAEKLSPVLSLYSVKDFAAGMDICESLLRFGGLGHTCVIHSKDDARIREYGLRMPAFRVLVNTPAPQGSTGITTNVFPSMTLGCGAMAGNITSDNIGPLHLINIKRITYAVRRPEEAFEVPAAGPARSNVDRGTVAAAVERYLASRGVSAGVATDVVAAVVDRFLVAKRGPGAGESPAPPQPQPQRVPEPAPPAIVDFVCEDDVREAQRTSRKIYVGPKTIITPSARDFGDQFGILVLAQR